MNEDVQNPGSKFPSSLTMRPFFKHLVSLVPLCATLSFAGLNGPTMSTHPYLSATSSNGVDQIYDVNLLAPRSDVPMALRRQYNLKKKLNPKFSKVNSNQFYYNFLGRNISINPRITK